MGRGRTEAEWRKIAMRVIRQLDKAGARGIPRVDLEDHHDVTHSSFRRRVVVSVNAILAERGDERSMSYITDAERRCYWVLTGDRKITAPARTRRKRRLLSELGDLEREESTEATWDHLDPVDRKAAAFAEVTMRHTREVLSVDLMV